MNNVSCKAFVELASVAVGYCRSLKADPLMAMFIAALTYLHLLVYLSTDDAQKTIFVRLNIYCHFLATFLKIIFFSIRA